MDIDVSDHFFWSEPDEIPLIEYWIFTLLRELESSAIQYEWNLFTP